MEFFLLFALLIPAWCHGVCSLLDRNISSVLRSDLRLDALSATVIDFSWILTHAQLTVVNHSF